MIALVTESAIFLQIMTINIIGNGSDLGCLICVSGWPRRGLINLFSDSPFFCGGSLSVSLVVANIGVDNMDLVYTIVW